MSWCGSACIGRSQSSLCQLSYNGERWENVGVLFWNPEGVKESVGTIATLVRYTLTS